ncbi:hypothetical protein C0J52_00529 [Blattella germanica]|nr:hypothetical protein C0J52_00529 [Blattella germanica]
MTSQPTTVVVGVGGKQHGGGTFQTSQTVTVEPYSTHVVKLEIGDVGPGNYNLTARGINGLEFVNTTRLDYVHKSYSVFIQTDKAIYKPGHKVQFRAVVLNAHLKPTVSSSLDVYITDGKGNRVKQWNRALTTKGVFSGELQLSQSPVLGDWNITVTVMGQTSHKSFQVAEYVLPKFEVTIDSPDHATFKDSHLVATVHAKYTYGRPVKGEATVTIYPTYYSGLLQPIFQNPVRKVLPIDGKVAVEFNIAKDLQLGDEYERSVQIDVAVEEELTGRRQNVTKEVMLHRYKYRMEIIKTSEYYKPGLMYTAYVKLTYHDGSPVQDDNNPVIVRYGYTYDQNEYIEESHKLQKNGLVELIFYPPVDANQTVLGIEAQYLDLKEWFSTISSSMSPSNTFIQAVIATENPKVNQDVEIDINSTEPLKYFNYQVIGRGDVVKANTIQVSNKKTHRLRFPITSAMAPTAHFVVYYIKDDGEVVADALDIEVDGTLQNFVNVNVNSEETKPGGNVEITVEAKPDSYVGILGIDQSVLLLKSGNDISEDAVIDELSRYDPGGDRFGYWPYWPPKRSAFRGRRSFYWWPGSATARQVFDNSGAVILTNGAIHEYFPFGTNQGTGLKAQNRPPFRPIPAPGVPVVKPDLGPAVVYKPVTRPPLAGPYAFSRIPTPVWNKPRVFLVHDIASTWLFTNLSSGTDGKRTIRETAPDTITSWIITGFSVDPVYGLGLTSAPGKLRVFRPFFISLDLPYSVIRGEIVAIPIVVFNYMNKDVVADPEGDTQFGNKAIFVDLRKSRDFNTTVTLDIPNNIVQGSDRVEVSAVGDILGPSIPNLDRLIKMPFGCGEQNMLNFVPNIVVIEYLKNTNQLTPAIEVKALQYMETGYQQELTYQRPDGSFSAFGNSDPNGIFLIFFLMNGNIFVLYSLSYYIHEIISRLTAFVAKSFRQAMPYIAIEEKVIQEALHWLSTNQAANGSFPEVGKVSHRDMQGGAAKGLALTAYTLIAFLENQFANQLYRNTINKALDYIVKNLDGVDDIYALALSSYALNLAQHARKDVVFNMFETKSQSSGDTKWWMKSLGQDEKKNPWYSLPNSVDVEMTAYGLLTYLQRGLVQDALPIMKWLVSQRNEQGGFASTQIIKGRNVNSKRVENKNDTVIGLQALAKLGEKMSSSVTDITVQFSYPGGNAKPIKINKANSMILQKDDSLPGKVRKVDITASGTGFALIQVSYQYNLNVTGAWPMFTLDPQVDKNSDSNHLQLSVCSGFVGTQFVNESNMAVMEVTLPSGFTVDTDALPSLEVSQHVKRVETKSGNTVVVLYFDKLVEQECFMNQESLLFVTYVKEKTAVDLALENLVNLLVATKIIHLLQQEWKLYWEALHLNNEFKKLKNVNTNILLNLIISHYSNLYGTCYVEYGMKLITDLISDLISAESPDGEAYGAPVTSQRKPGKLFYVRYL